MSTSERAKGILTAWNYIAGYANDARMPNEVTT